MGWIVSERFRNIDEIEKVECPILLIHGKNDNLININNSYKLLDKINIELKNK